MSADIASRLESLKLQYASFNAESLLKLCTAIYVRSRSQCYRDYMHYASSLYQNWYTDMPKFDTVHVNQYPAFSYPAVCVCGNKFSPTSSKLQYHCAACKGDWNLCLIDPYEVSQLSKIAQVNPYYFESIVAKVIYYDLAISRPKT